MSFIKTIEIKNFKSIRHQKIEGCRRINVFVGHPNVGKSNVLEALSNFSITGKSHLYSDYVRVGKLTTLFFNGNVDDDSQVILNDNFRVLFSFEKNEVLAFAQLDKFKSGFELIDKKFDSPDFIASKDWDKHVFNLAGFIITGDNGALGNYGGDFGLPLYKDDEINLSAVTENQRIPILKYEFKKNVQYSDVDAWKLMHPFGDNIFEIISTRSQINKDVTELFEAYGLNFVYDAGSREYKILKILDKKIFTVPYSMIADTLQRLIFYKAAIASNKNAVLLFEEPEAHMFPPYIAKFTSDMISDENNNQFFVATHSPFVLNDLMENLKGDELAIYIVSYKSETGETLVNRMSDDEVHEAYQFGYDFFMNINQFLPQVPHE
jgi:predicted ATPase